MQIYDEVTDSFYDEEKVKDVIAFFLIKYAPPEIVEQLFQSEN